MKARTGSAFHPRESAAHLCGSWQVATGHLELMNRIGEHLYRCYEILCGQLICPWWVLGAPEWQLLNFRQGFTDPGRGLRKPDWVSLNFRDGSVESMKCFRGSWK